MTVSIGSSRCDMAVDRKRNPIMCICAAPNRNGSVTLEHGVVLKHLVHQGLSPGS